MSHSNGAVPLIEARSLSRRYGDRIAVDGLSFELEAGEIFGFLGPNGAGKSTTFHMLAGLLAPDSGEIRFKGHAVNVHGANFRARLGVVFQSPSLDPLLTARENLRLHATLYGIPRAMATQRIAERLALVELEDRADERIASYSGGMRRRLEIARVLLHDPELLILDEPGQGLDLAGLRRIWDRLRSVADARRVGILATTHSPEEAENCDRLAVLDAGKLVACDSPAALRSQLGGDVIVIESANDEADVLASEIEKRFGIRSRRAGNELFLEQPRGHELIPRLVEALTPARLKSVGMRPPALGDVFAKLTGKELH